MENVKSLGNILWFILGGWIAGTIWLLTGALCYLTIIGIPFATACFRISSFAYFPFGKELVDARDVGEERIAMTGLANFLWVILIGLWTSISFVLAGVTMCCGIVTIPFGIAYFKLAVAGFAPLGKRIVSTDMARVIRERKASGELDRRLDITKEVVVSAKTPVSRNETTNNHDFSWKRFSSPSDMFSDIIALPSIGRHDYSGSQHPPMKRLLPILSLLLAAVALLLALDTLLKTPRRREVLEAKQADLRHLQTLLAARQPQRDFLASAPAPDLLDLAAAHFPPDAVVLSALPPLEGPDGLALHRQTLTLRRIPYSALPPFLDAAARQSCRLESLDLTPAPAPAIGDATLTFLTP